MRDPARNDKIFPLRGEDRERWGQLWAQYQEFYQVAFSVEVTNFTWARILVGRIHGLGARDTGGRLVGIVHFLFHEDTWSESPSCYLQDLYVESGARGGGFGGQLIRAVAEASTLAGAQKPYWLTHETNTTARLLYDRVGKNHGFLQYAYVDGRR